MAPGVISRATGGPPGAPCVWRARATRLATTLSARYVQTRSGALTATRSGSVRAWRSNRRERDCSISPCPKGMKTPVGCTQRAPMARCCSGRPARDPGPSRIAPPPPHGPGIAPPPRARRAAPVRSPASRVPAGARGDSRTRPRRQPGPDRICPIVVPVTAPSTLLLWFQPPAHDAEVSRCGSGAGSGPRTAGPLLDGASRRPARAPVPGVAATALEGGIQGMGMTEISRVVERRGAGGGIGGR